MNDQQLEKVKAEIRQKYDGEMSLLTAGGLEIIVRPPDRTRFSRFRDLLMDEKKRGAAMEAFVKSCMLYPSPAEYDAATDSKPAVTMKFADKLAEMAGASFEAEEKKL